MTPEDRDLLLSLRRQQDDLRQKLEGLTAQLNALEARTAETAPEVLPMPDLPPLPIEVVLPPIPSTFDRVSVADSLPPIPAAPTAPTSPVSPALPPLPPIPTAKPSFESQFGRWLTRVGALLLVVGFVYFATLIDATYHLHERLGPSGKLGLMGLASVLILALGQRLERKTGSLLFFGRTLMAAGLACLYVTIYAACFYEPLRVIGSPLCAGILLLLWSFYVFLLAERRNSQLLALFSVTLAYIGTALNPVGPFTMGADLLLAFTAVVFLLRHGWAAVSTFSLIGTYLALLRRLVLDENGELVLDTSRTLPFWPYATYLIGAWFLFTTAVVLARSPTFRGGKRLAFLSLNNAALAGLLALTAYIAGYGTKAIGWTLLDAGLVFLVASRFAGFAEIEPVEVMGAYAAQGLALFTGGIIVVYTGITRGVLLLIETFLLGVAGAFAGDRILTISTYVSAFFTTLFLVWEIAVNAHHPWLLGFGGALVMLINAWASRGEIRYSPRARSTFVLSTSCFCVMAVALIYTALSAELSDAALPPALALAALALTFAIYYVTLYELPPIAQTLLLAAQARVLFPAETGVQLPGWTTAWVAFITLILVTWWARQGITRSGPWTLALIFLYALVLVRLTVQAVHPHLDAQGWMIAASLLSIVFLVYGAFTRVWAVAAVGQIFLGLALYHLFFPPDPNLFPWTWSAAAVPVMVVFATARAAQEWLRLFTEIPPSWRRFVGLLADGYLLLALAGLIRWVLAVIPALDQMAAFLLLGTLVFSLNVRRPSAFGVRCSFVLSAIGAWLYLDHFQADALALSTFLNGLALLLFLTQAALLRPDTKSLITRAESWALILVSVGTSWIFVSSWAWTRLSHHSLTLGWALFALFLFLFGLIVRESRLRQCGLAILFAAIVRVFCSDLWGLSSGYRVLTFLVLALIALGVGYLLLRRGDRLSSVSK